jgi:hypothetical protein
VALDGEAPALGPMPGLEEPEHLILFLLHEEQSVGSGPQHRPAEETHPFLRARPRRDVDEYMRFDDVTIIALDLAFGPRDGEGLYPSMCTPRLSEGREPSFCDEQEVVVDEPFRGEVLDAAHEASMQDLMPLFKNALWRWSGFIKLHTGATTFRLENEPDGEFTLVVGGSWGMHKKKFTRMLVWGTTAKKLPTSRRMTKRTCDFVKELIAEVNQAKVNALQDDA